MLRILAAACLMIASPWMLSASAQSEPVPPEVEQLENMIGLSKGEIVERFGGADEAGLDEDNQVVIWTYADKGYLASDSASEYLHIAFWGDRVASVGILAYTPEADSLYGAALAFFEEGGTTVMKAAGDSNNRLTRRGDNIWSVDKGEEEHSNYVDIRVGDAGYRMCSRAVASEVERVQQQYGIRIQSENRQ